MQRLITTHEATMIEFIDLPTCNPFATADGYGPSSSSEPPRLLSIGENPDCLRRHEASARGRRETLPTYPGVRETIWHRFARRLLDGGGHIILRLPSWLGRFLSDVDVHHWPAPYH
jgi:serine O-acetyltransferase